MITFGIIVGIATIIGAIYAALQYHSRNNNVKETNVPEYVQKEKESIVLSTEASIYKGDRNWLLTMYEAARKISYSTSRDSALSDVVDAALKLDDYNMAIIAAEKIIYQTTRDDTLVKIVSIAVGKKETFGYALLAAGKIIYSTTKTKALMTVIEAAKKEAKCSHNKQ